MTYQGVEKKSRCAYGILGACIVVWAIIFGVNSLLTNKNLWFSAYDVAKHDQSLWMLSHFQRPFNTIRGLNTFGDHAYFTLPLLAPIYWFFPSINALLFITPFVRGLAVLGVFLIAKDRLRHHGAALFVALLMLLDPAFGNVNLDHFYPETWATASFVFMFYFAVIRPRWAWYYALLGLTLLMKEDTPLVAFMFALYLLVIERRVKHAAITAITSLAYFGVSIALISYFAGTYSVFQESGGQMGGVLAHALQPSFYAAKFLEPAFLTYLFNLGSPIAFLPILSPHVLAIAFPSLLANMVSNWPYLKSINYHYTIYITPFLYIAFVYALQLIQRHVKRTALRKGIFVSLFLVTGISSITANQKLAILPVSKFYQETLAKYHQYRYSGAVKTTYQGFTLIDASSPVSVDTFFTPHLAHRRKCYQFPVPWMQNYYGVTGTPLPSPDDVKYVFVKYDTLSQRERDLIHSLLLKNYAILMNENGLLLLQQAQTPFLSMDETRSVLLRETFDEHVTLGKAHVWSGALTWRGFSDERFVSDDREAGASYRLISADGMDAEWYYMLPVRPNTLYRFSGWIDAQGLTPLDAQVHGIFFLQYMKDRGEYNFGDVTSTIKFDQNHQPRRQGNWLYQEMTFLTSRDTQQVRISASFGSWGRSKGEMFLDHLQLEQLSR